MLVWERWEHESADEGARYWSAQGPGVYAPFVGPVSLLDTDGVPANHKMPVDHADYLMRFLMASQVPADDWPRRWDYYATAAGVA